VAQDIDLDFKPQYLQKNKKKKKGYRVNAIGYWFLLV
jgi:hypothetical protein